MSIFNDNYRESKNFIPVNLYNWSIEFVLDGNAYKAMNNQTYGGEIELSWEEQSKILSFACKKCNLPKKKFSEVKTWCRGLQASFNGGVTIDSSLSLSFDESSSRIVSKILNRLSSLYADTNYIAEQMKSGNDKPGYSLLNKVSLSNVENYMVGGTRGKQHHTYYFEDSDIENGHFENKDERNTDYNNRDLTVIVKIFANKLGYVNPRDYSSNVNEDIKPIKEFIFTKCFINNLKFGDGFSYESEENLSIDCDVMYNWYNFKEDYDAEIEIRKIDRGIYSMDGYIDRSYIDRNMKGYTGGRLIR